jgi:hypothetical protein
MMHQRRNLRFPADEEVKQEFLYMKASEQRPFRKEIKFKTSTKKKIKVETSWNKCTPLKIPPDEEFKPKPLQTRL